MKTSYYLIAVLGLAVLGTASAKDKEREAAASKVDVTFVDPEKFSDVKADMMNSDSGRNAILDQLKEHMQITAARRVPDAQHLEIKVLDVDLAGDIQPRGNPRLDDIRFMKDIYPPRLKLEFKLTDASGKVISEGQRSLVDMSYLMTTTPISNDPLKYDKELISDWIRREFRK